MVILTAVKFITGRCITIETVVTTDNTPIDQSDTLIFTISDSTMTSFVTDTSRDVR